jgi:hypothetical protein
MTTPPTAKHNDSPSRWPWVTLAVGISVAVLVRLPLIASADAHLDSDLAVDGLTLIDAVRGHWRWHYPGTPHMGIPPVLLSIIQAVVLGPTPQALVSGGVVAYVLVMLSIFSLAWRVYGPRAAGWSVVPLALASPGLIWLSGRITGGHLLSVAWFTATCGLLGRLVERPSPARALAIGLAAGTGAYLDRMLLLPGLLACFLALPVIVSQTMRAMIVSGILLLMGLGLGFLPARLGEAQDPYDAYGSQFETILWTTSPVGVTRWTPRGEVAELLQEHGRILALECVPRLFAGHRLPDFRSEPWTRSIPGISVLGPDRLAQSAGPIAIATTWGMLVLGSAGFVALLLPIRDPVGRVVRNLLVLVALASLAGFLLNRHIYNSDNYRYLVLLIPAWSLGIGRAMDRLTQVPGRVGRIGVGAMVVVLAGFTSFDVGQWYQSLGLIGGSGQDGALERSDPAYRYLMSHLGEFDAIFADYWDAYRLSFLTGGRVVGVPYPNYPNRFPEQSRRLPGNRPRVLFARRNGLGLFYLREALSGGGQVIEWPNPGAAPGISRVPAVAVVDWPQPTERAEQKGAAVGD